MSLIFNSTDLLHRGERPLLRAAVLSYLAAAAIYVVFRYLLAIGNGGHVWTTGDWLLSYRAGFVRRGLTGSITYGLTDLTGINALYVAAATQILIYASLVASVLFMVSRLRITVPVALLAISPVFLLVWFFIIKNAMTKEMIGFLGFSLVGLSAFTRRKWPLWIGVLVFAAAGFAHEINAFMATDLFALLAVLSFAGAIPRRQAMVAAIAVAVAVVSALLTAVLFNGSGMGDSVCQVILSYGGKPEFCGHQGPTVWLDRDLAYGMQFTWEVNVLSGVWPWFVLGFILSMMPFLLFRVSDDSDGHLTRLVLLAAFGGMLMYAPLFVIASDWGRWIGMHVFCLTILTFVALRLGLIRERFDSMSPLFLVFALVWAMPDYGAPLTTGLLRKALSLAGYVERFLG